MKLYYAPGTGSFVVEATLVELGLTFDRQKVDLDAGEQGSAEFLALNPRGQVPALVLDDGSVLTESAAIALFLADKHGRLLPPSGTAQRAAVMRWLFFAASNLYEAALRVFYTDRYTTDEAGVAAVKQAAEQEFERCAGIVEQAVGAGPCLLGETLSVFDLHMAMLLEWHWDKPRLFAAHPGLERLHRSVSERPSLAGVWAENF